MAVAQPAAVDDLAEGRRLLREVRDHEFRFDDEAFYWFVEKVRTDATAKRYDVAEDEAPVNWRHLLERPDDYRGRLVVVQGRLMRHEQYRLTDREQLGTLHQCELADPTTRAICTVVLTQSPGNIRTRSLVRCKGFFIKVRDYATDSGDEGSGPLVVAPRLEFVASPTSGTGAEGQPVPGTGWIVGVTALLALVWVLMRRNATRPIPEELPHRAGGTVAPSSADFDWLEEGASVNDAAEDRRDKAR